MGHASRSIRAEVNGANIVVTLPVKTLIWACEHQPEFPLRVKNKAEFTKYVADQLLSFDEDETGATAFERLLDELFIKAFEDGLDMEQMEIE